VLKEIALFGGSFDPPHEAHRRLLASIHDHFHFDKIWIIPSKFPPGKMPKADFSDRLNWTKRIFNLAPYEVSDLEANSSHTIFAKDIIYRLQLEHPEAQHFWILGEDQWEQLPYWKNVDDYASNLIWIVMSRSKAHQFPFKSTRLLSRRLLKSSCSYIWADIELMAEISSTAIREWIMEEGLDLTDEKLQKSLPETIQNDVYLCYKKLIKATN